MIKNFSNCVRVFVRRVTRWAWKKEISTCEGLAVLKGLNMDDEKMDAKIKQDPDLAYWIAKCFASMLVDCPNYREVRFNIAGRFNGKTEWIVVHVQRSSGKTPHQLRQEAERELEQIKAKMKEAK